MIPPVVPATSSEAKPPFGRLTLKQAAEVMRVSVRSIERIRRVHRFAPDLHARIQAGELSTCQAEGLLLRRMGKRPDKLLAAVILAHTAINRIRQLAGDEYGDLFAQVFEAGELLASVRQSAVTEEGTP